MQSILKAPIIYQEEPETAIDFAAWLAPIASPQIIELAPGETLFCQGADADTVFALVNGRLIVKKETETGLDMVLDYLEEGSLVGQLEVWTGQTRAATVQAETAARLVHVSMATFKRWLRVNPEAHRVVAALSLPSIRYYQLAGVLGRLFEPADTTFLPALIQRLTWHHFANGETVFRQGDAGHNLYLVVNGHLRLQITDEEGQVQPAGDVHSGEMAGEYSVLANAPHATTGVAVRESNVVALAKADFQQLCAEYPQTMLAWTLSTVQRRQATALQAMST
ncbi:MAG TPA: cyclic nucleotide-binding domain-containing protein, partial [Anaerolineae bacterium]